MRKGKPLTAAQIQNYAGIAGDAIMFYAGIHVFARVSKDMREAVTDADAQKASVRMATVTNFIFMGATGAVLPYAAEAAMREVKK